MAKKDKTTNGLSLRERIMKNTISSYAAYLPESDIYGHRWQAPTPIPMMNVALSGKMNGGVQPGLTIIAGPTKHFKTGFCLEFAAAFQRQFPEGIVIFYDSEFGSPPDYFASRGVDMDRVLHVPILDIEDLQFEVSAQLENLERNDPVFILVDSLGNLASKKEKEDMLKQEGKTDMTRAKAYKSFFRVVTPLLNLKNVPMFAISHTYQTMEMFSKSVVSGGEGLKYSADNIWIVGREQIKDGSEVEGFKFKINIDKSRFVQEKSQFPINVTWEGGIDKYSGLLDVAIEGKFIERPTLQTYRFAGDSPENDFKLKDLEAKRDKYYNRLLHNKDFVTFVEQQYQIPAELEPEMEMPDD